MRRPLQRPPTFTSLHLALTLCLLSAGGCFSPVPAPLRGPQADPELVQATAAARSAFQRGTMVEAIMLYRRALKRARAMDDAAEVGNAGYNLGACLLQAGRYDEAGAMLRDAEMETIRAAGPSGAGANVADVLLLEAKAARFAGRPVDAVRFADRVLRDQASRPSPVERVQVDVLKGDIACEANDPIAASNELARARRDLGDRPAAAMRAAVDGLEARVALAKGDAAHAAPLFDRQAGELQQAGLYREMARALARAGQAWSSAKSPPAAADRLFRAGRASAAQGDAAEAGRLLAQAADEARQAGDGPLGDRIQALRDEVAPTTRPGE